MQYSIRKAKSEDLAQIWNILAQAIRRRKEEGSTQWQDGYPNPSIVERDIAHGAGYVLTDGPIVIAYWMMIVNGEPAYNNIAGKWLTNGDYVVYHRVAVLESYLGKGLAKQMLNHVEAFALQNNINSIRADTNFDNKGMLWLFEKLGYQFCGEVTFRGAPRRAFEKLLS